MANWDIWKKQSGLILSAKKKSVKWLLLFFLMNILLPGEKQVYLMEAFIVGLKIGINGRLGEIDQILHLRFLDTCQTAYSTYPRLIYSHYYSANLGRTEHHACRANVLCRVLRESIWNQCYSRAARNKVPCLSYTVFVTMASLGSSGRDVTCYLNVGLVPFVFLRKVDSHSTQTSFRKKLFRVLSGHKASSHS